jgi:anti-sigma B factor antagonist
MEIETRDVGLVTIARMPERIILGAPNVALRETLLALLDDDRRRILLDLEATSYVDSSGLAELVACTRRAHERNGAVKLLRPLTRIRDLLRLTGLDTVFEVFSDEREAIASFDVHGVTAPGRFPAQAERPPGSS